MLTFKLLKLKLFRSEQPPSPVRFLKSDFFFGGVPSDVDAAISMSSSFVGCISDVTFNGKIINFAQLTDAPGSTIGKCQEQQPSGFRLPKRNNTSSFK